MQRQAALERRNLLSMAEVVKTPLPLLGLLILALAGRGRDSARPGALAAAWLALVVYATLTTTRGLNIGHRHLLPLYPFVFVVAGCAGAWLPRRFGSKGAVLLGALLGWYAWGTLRVHPHPLAYFNETVGGPSNGWRVLVDSSLDWGQDLTRVEPWMREHGVTRYKLSYFGTASPEYHGVTGEMLPSYTAPRLPRVTREIVPVRSIFSPYQAVKPPSTTSSNPVTYAEALEARNSRGPR